MADDVRSAWRQADVLAIALGRSVSFLGEVATLTVLTLRVHDAGGGAGGVTALLVAGFLPFVLLLPLTGRVVDRFARRPVVVAASLLQSVVAAALTLGSGVVVTVALAAVLGAGQAVAGAAWQALLVDVVGRERLTPALGVVQALRTVAGIAGPGVAGLLVGALGPRTPMGAVAVVFALTAVLAVRVRVPATGAVAVAPTPTATSTATADVGPDHGAPPPASQEAEAAPTSSGSWALVRADRLLATLLATIGGVILLVSMDNVVEVFFVRDTLGASTTWYGAVVTTWSVGVLLGSLTGRVWEGGVDVEQRLARGVVGSTLLVVVAVGAFAAVPSVAWLVPVSVLGGTTNGVLNLTISSLVLRRAPEGAVGRISAVVSATTSGAQIGSTALGGALLAVLDPRQVYVVAGVAGVTLALAVGPVLLRAARAPDVTPPVRA